MDERSHLLGQSEPDLQPSLRPRHQQLMPTPCGPMKRWSELSVPHRVYLSLSLLSLLVLLGLTLSSLLMQRVGHENFTVSLIQIITLLFCVYYSIRGVLQENTQELIVFMLSVMVLMIRAVVNFAVLGTKDQRELQVRFGFTMAIGTLLLLSTLCLMRMPHTMAFRVSGASSELQSQYFLLSFCFSLVTFDLQAQLCLCILICTTDSPMTLTDSVLLGVGVAWSVLTAAVGAVAVLKKVRALVWTFMALNLPQVAFLVFLMYKTAVNWPHDTVYTPEAAAVLGSVLSLIIKGALLWGLCTLLRHFGLGTREQGECSPHIHNLCQRHNNRLKM